MKKSLIALALTGVIATPALAQTAAPASPHSFTGNFTLASDYVFRGISQTQHNPAVQGGIDYAHSSGIYLGIWGSNVSWVKETGLKNNNSMEVDFYGGYKWPLAADTTLDLGAVHYNYPGNQVAGLPTPNSTEIYAGLTWKFLTIKYNHAVSKNLFAWQSAPNERSKGSGYIDLTANFDLGNGWGVTGHVGHQKIRKFHAADAAGIDRNASYTDWKLGVSKDIGFGTLALAYTGNNAKGNCALAQPYCWGAAPNQKDVSKDRLFLSFSKTF